MILKALPADYKDTRYIIYGRTKSGLYSCLHVAYSKADTTNWIIACKRPKSSIYVAIVRAEEVMSEKLDYSAWLSYTKTGYEPERWETLC